MPPAPRIDVDSMAPHTSLGLSRFLLDVPVPVAVGSDRISFPDKPFPDILAVAGYDADGTPEFVLVLDCHENLLAADLPDQCALHPLSMSEPVAVPVLCHLVPFGRVQAGESHFLAGHAYSVAVGDICFPGERAVERTARTGIGPGNEPLLRAGLAATRRTGSAIKAPHACRPLVRCSPIGCPGSSTASGPFRNEKLADCADQGGKGA